jgi:hypothetical protein
MLQKAAGKEKCSSAEHIVRKSVASDIFSLVTHSRSKVRGGQKTILIHINLLFSLLVPHHNLGLEFDIRISKLSYSPCPCAILFVITRSLVHNGKPVATPNWRILVIQIRNSFRLVRECAESRTFRKVEGNHLP